jgi:transposase-like protein
MDETAVSVRGGAHYLYRAVDKHGKSVESLLCSDRSESAARAFFNKALTTHQLRRPRKVNIDGSAASHGALRVLQEEDPAWRSVVIRSRRYLNNIVEQDHRAIKSRCAPMLAFKSFRTAAVTLAGVELAHRIRKRQFSFGRGRPPRISSLKQLWARALACDDAKTKNPKARPPTRVRFCTCCFAIPRR